MFARLTVALLLVACGARAQPATTAAPSPLQVHELDRVAAEPHGPPAPRAPATGNSAIQGVVTDRNTGEKLAGVTVIATWPALAQTRTAITDDTGSYKVSDLPPGDYVVTFYYADITVEHDRVHVGSATATPVFQQLHSSAAGGPVIHVHDTAPTIDERSPVAPPPVCVYLHTCRI